jgi:hypothetical protein
MSLPALYAVPQDDASWLAWAFNHQANHFDIITAGTRYQQTSVTLTTNIGSLAGGFVLGFAATSGVQIGMNVSNSSNPTYIPVGAEVVNFNATEVQIGLPIAHNILSGDNILFSPGANVRALAQYQLSPIDRDNLGMWLYTHSIMHSQINQVLVTQGFNLLDYDWDDPEQFQEWLQANGDEHVRICSALGIG